jgi:flagellar hook-associated protein 1 FlgK
MSLNGIASAALSALQTNSTALKVVSNNVANINTAGYARRVVQQQAVSVGGQLGGVQISDIQRVVDKFLNAETLSAQSGSSRYDAQSTIFSQLDGLLGQPGDSTSLTSRLTALSQSLGQAALSPTTSANQVGALNSLQNLASTISNLAGQVTTLRNQVDQQVSTSVASVNSLIKQIYDLNTQIKSSYVGGDNSSALLDQRDVALQSLSQLVGVKVNDLGDGRISVMTEDGINLVGDTYSQLSYTPGASNGTYGSVTFQDINPNSGQPISGPQAFEPHLGSGKLKGLIEMRDGALGEVGQEIGNLAKTTANAYNAVSNANTAYPPPSSLSGRNTGLLSTDALNFTGKTTLAIADSSGNLVERVDVDFDAGTISVNGTAVGSTGSDVGSFVSALNSALGSDGTAVFKNGALSLTASGSNGIALKDDAAAPASRGGAGFSQFFGLNDLFTSGVPTLTATGLSSSDASGFAAGGQISFQLKGPNGQIARTAAVTLTAGMAVGNVVTALNTAMGGSMTFSLGSDGSLTATPSSNYSNYTLNVTADTTQRGTTGMSLSQLFGIGSSQLTQLASTFAVSSAITTTPARLPFAQAQITAATAVGDTIVGPGDNSGVVALQNVGSASQSFAKAGGMAAEVASLADYAAAFYQDIATRGSTATANQTTQADRLQEAQTRQSATSGVNLDEELSNMMTYQQAYSAGARMLQVVQQLFDTLLQVQ